jgi:hypothetical protein
VSPVSEPVLRFGHGWRALAWTGVVVLVAASLAPAGEPLGPEHFDKLLHAVAYASVAFAFGGFCGRTRYLRTGFGLLLLGAALEVAQLALTADRSADWLDLAANAAGILTGLSLAALFPQGWCCRLEALMGQRG